MRMWRATLFGIVCLFVVGMDGLSHRGVSAAGSPLPTVSIRRNPVFSGPVLSGDFNRDGIADLVGTTADPANPSGLLVVTVALGKGDGSLGALIRTHFTGPVLAVGDLNADGRLDLIVNTANAGAAPPHTDLVALRGNGDGTFATAGYIVTSPGASVAVIADLDGDGHSDVAAGSYNDGDNRAIVVEQGHGDFTFTFARFLVGDDAVGATVADVNGDGKPDLVTANSESETLSIFMNQGALQFTASPMTLRHSTQDVAAADLNGDGRIDLVVATSNASHPAYDVGYATVLLGAGGGTFAAPVDYPTPPGAWRVVIGDFNRDGIVDIATANRSSIYYDALCSVLQTWDSMSILPGKGDGTFTAPSNFSIGNQLKSDDPITDRNTVVSLVAADLNGDHALDLAVSNGTVFLNKSADPNWAPTVDAGPDQTLDPRDDHFVILHARASDVDQDMLTYAWFDSTGDFVPQVPSPCFSPHVLGVHTYTVVVDDGHGHTATDSMTVDFGSDGGGGGGSTSLGFIAPAVGTTIVAGRPYEIKFHVDDTAQALYEWSIDYSTDDGATWNHIWECHNAGRSSGPGVPTSRDESCTWQNPGPPSAHTRMVVYAQDDADAPIGTQGNTNFAIQAVNGAVPDPWRHQDIGAVGVGGSATASNATTFGVTAHGADIWGTADAFHFLYQDGNEVSPVDSGAWEVTAHVLSVTNTDPWTKAGLMIREGLGASARHASVFVSPGKGMAFQRRTTTGGASVSTTGPALMAPVWLKLGVKNGTVTAYYRKALTDPWTIIGQQAFTEFSSVSAGIAVTAHNDSQPATANFDNVDLHQDPAFMSKDVGTTGGSITSDGVITTMTAKGTDVWGTSDQFRYATGSFGDTVGSITARVRSVQNVNAWTKAGVMYRELSTTGTIEANAKYVFVMVSPGHGVTMQYRSATGGAAASVATAPIAGTAPGWVRLSRNGDTFTGEWSSDGATWTTVGTATVSFAAANGSDSLLALTSHSSSTATASFDDVVISRP